MAASATALLIASVATGGAALILAGTIVGGVKTMEGIRKLHRNYKIKLNDQIRVEAHLAALSAQLGNPAMIELGLLLIFNFADGYEYATRYRAIENGLKFSDWYDAYVEGFQSFAKVK